MPEPVSPPEGRAAYVISQLYYYVAAVVGVGFAIGGLVALLFGVRTLVLPREFEQARDGGRVMLIGVSFAIPGLLTLRWHLREARRREGQIPAGAFWGRALYFHLVALIAVIFVLGGTVGVLVALVDAVLPRCFDLGPAPLVAGSECYPEASDAARSAVDAAIFILAGGPMMWWHLRQGRRLTAPA